jgi:hypothetical protein
MKDGSEEEPMIGLASPLYCLQDEELEGNSREIRGEQKYKADIASYI